MVESDGLENHCRIYSTEGSNPSLSSMLDLNIGCAVILNGTMAKNDVSFLKNFDAIKIAADGAANILIKNKIIPNYVVGDLDSFNFKLAQTTNLINVPNQNQYDFEKCLEFSIENTLNNVLVFGINGGLFDHTLNNWSIFVKYSSQINLFCYNEGQIGTLITEDTSFNSEIGDIISIIPTPTATLTTEGLKWNLDNTTLEIGKTEGARNKAINKNISIKLHFGKYMLFKSVSIKSGIYTSL